MQVFVSLSAPKIYYRGLAEDWNDEHAKKQHMTWVTPDREYAELYAEDGRLYKFHADPGRYASLNFRSLWTEVKFAEIHSRVKKLIMEAFQDKRVGRDEALTLVSRLDKLNQLIPASKHKRVYMWWDEYTEISKILRLAGYDSIKGNEGDNHDVPTFGIFDHTRVKMIKD
ncbi:hypothetical protein HOT49_gp197 [Erwinia phage vB_EamM_Alexandra]|uniref:Uncharacterized protein n=1 Tax=Erwinia phage vB_EamM_Alexandra TaxID=2201424 RepID=A0A2Z4QEW3_9CAUD|nr:hypothetical protein HOT49_gp197 [Erwinia phage vB_EamM_Alexandra]AWY08464.1 hypothetical protein Alexandra_199 [Erwinia phage vB_EamM_Alexandra]